VNRILRKLFGLVKKGSKWVDEKNYVTRKIPTLYLSPTIVIKRRKVECAINVSLMGQVRNPDKD
jgi:hypothetical protein